MYPLVSIKLIIQREKNSKCMMSLGDHLAGKIPMPMLSRTKCTNIGNNLNIQICRDILKLWKVMIILTPFIDRDAMMLFKKLHPIYHRNQTSFQ